MQDFQDFQDDVFRSGTVFLCHVRDQAIANYRGVFGSVTVFLCPCRGGRRVSHKFGNPGNLVHLANPAQFSVQEQSSCVMFALRRARTTGAVPMYPRQARFQTAHTHDCTVSYVTVHVSPALSNASSSPSPIRSFANAIWSVIRFS